MENPIVSLTVLAISHFSGLPPAGRERRKGIFEGLPRPPTGVFLAGFLEEEEPARDL